MTTKIIALTCIAMAANCYAQDFSSFRMQSTGYLMSDDLDLIMDPLELGHVKGFRLYTNLSNLGSGQEEAMGSMTDNTLVLGLGGDLPLFEGARGAVLFMRRKAEDALPVSLDLDDDGVGELSANGQVSGEYERYFDAGIDGLYDYRIHRDGSSVNAMNSVWNTLVATGSYELEDMFCGFRLRMASEDHQDEISNAWSYRHYDLDPSYQTTELTLRTLNLEDEENHNLALDLSVQGEMGDGEAGAMLTFAKQRWNLDLKSLDGDDRQHFSEDDLMTDYGSSQSVITANSSLNIAGVDATIRYREALSTEDERRHQSFWALEAGAGYWSGTAEDNEGNVSDDISWYPVIRENTWTQVTDLTDGEVSLVKMALSGRWVKALDDRVRVALGIGFSRKLWTYDLVGRNAYLYRDSTVVQDDIWNSNDEWSHRSSGTTYDNTREYRTDEMSLPVGLEYLMGKQKNWTLRLSARYTSSREVVDQLSQVRDADPLLREWFDGDGYYSAVLDENEYTSSASHQNTRTSTTTFAYGLGFAPTPSLQLDFLSFFGTEDNSILDASFYRNLRLSATLRL